MYTTVYKLFHAPRNRNLKRKTWIAHTIWNYFLGWQRTRYSLELPYLSYKEMSREFRLDDLRFCVMLTPRYLHTGASWILGQPVKSLNVLMKVTSGSIRK